MLWTPLHQPRHLLARVARDPLNIAQHQPALGALGPPVARPAQYRDDPSVALGIFTLRSNPTSAVPARNSRTCALVACLPSFISITIT